MENVLNTYIKTINTKFPNKKDKKYSEILVHIPQQMLKIYSHTYWKHSLENMLNCLEQYTSFTFHNPQLDLFLVQDFEIARHNKNYMNCVGATNILSFPAEEVQNAPYIHNLGTLVLSINTLEREARLFGQDINEHAVRLLAHGLIHLLGYDHGEEMQALTDLLENNCQITEEKTLNTFIPFWSYYHG